MYFIFTTRENHTCLLPVKLTGKTLLMHPFMIRTGRMNSYIQGHFLTPGRYARKQHGRIKAGYTVSTI